MPKKKKDTAPKKFQHDAAHIASMRKRGRPSRKRKQNPGAAIVGTSTAAARHALDKELLLTNPVHSKPPPKGSSRDTAYRTNVLTPWRVVGRYSCLISAANVATGLQLQTKDFPLRESNKEGYPMKDLHKVFDTKGKFPKTKLVRDALIVFLACRLSISHAQSQRFSEQALSVVL